MRPSEELREAAITCRIIAGMAETDSWADHWQLLAQWLDHEAETRGYDTAVMVPYLHLQPGVRMARKINKEAQP